MPEEKIGEVTRFFAKPMVAAIKLSAPLARGDRIRVKGHTTDITTVVGSMQIEHQPVEKANAGDDIGLQLPERARDGDSVYRVTDD